MDVLGAPTVLKETTGAKLRRLARQALNNNAWSRPYMKAVGPWQPSTAVTVSAMCVNSGNLYVCQTAGTTASSGGPTATNGQAITDGTAKWYYFGPNQVTQDPVTSTPAWAASTAKSLSNLVVNGAGVYACVVAGTTASSGGPTGTGNVIVDGTATWTYMGAVYGNPYASDFPTYSYSATAAPATQTNIFGWYGSGSGSASNKFSAIAPHSVISGGSGYVVGEVVTLTGGTFTTAAQVTVKAVDGGGAITSATVTTPGAYTQLPTALPVGQGSTTGAGTGATFYIHFTQPGWCRIRGGDPIRLQNGNWCVPGIAQTLPGANERFQTIGMEFVTDAQAVTFRLLTGAASNLCIIIDGVRYNITPVDIPNAASNNNFYTLTFPSRKVRRWRLEQHNSAGFSLPPIYVDSSSLVWAPPDQDYVKAAFIGDSLTDGATPGPVVTGNCVALGTAHELGWSDPWNHGVGTTGHVHQNPTSAGNQFGYRIQRVTLTNPDIWVIMGSWNDLTESTSAITAAVTAEIASIRAAGSRAPIVYIGIWSANGGASVGTTEDAVKAGIVDSLNNTYWIPIFRDVFAPWILGSWNNNPTPVTAANLSGSTNANLYVDTPNSPHPADIGTVYEWRRMAEAIRTYVLPLIA